MNQFITCTVEDRVCIITLNRPEKRNALNQRFVLELITAFKKAEDNIDIKVVILKSSADTFSAGADLQYLQQLQEYSFEENLDDSKQLSYLFSTIYNFSKPVVAQVSGDAIAGGCGLATVCDVIFATPESRFGYTEVKIGFVPALVAAFLIRRIGEGRSREMLLSGNLIAAEVARNYGLVSFISSKDEIDAEVLRYAKKLTKEVSSQSVALTKKLLSKLSALSLDDSLEYAEKVNAKARLSDDCKKGINAFISKKPFEW